MKSIFTMIIATIFFSAYTYAEGYDPANLEVQINNHGFKDLFASSASGVSSNIVVKHKGVVILKRQSLRTEQVAADTNAVIQEAIANGKRIAVTSHRTLKIIKDGSKRAQSSSTDKSYIASLEEELKHSRKMIEELQGNLNECSSSLGLDHYGRKSVSNSNRDEFQRIKDYIEADIEDNADNPNASTQ